MWPLILKSVPLLEDMIACILGVVTNHDTNHGLDLGEIVEYEYMVIC